MENQQEPTPKDYRIGALKEDERWKTLAEHLEDIIQSKTRRLTGETFTDLSEVARLQGEITGIQSVISAVNNRWKKIRGV